LAVVEYTYERDGQIVIPAGAKAVGHIQEADRSGYVRIQFESLMMPDGATVPIQGIATDLDMRPLKGKVEGKNTGKKILVRSLSGIGQAGALLLGQGSLNQPLSESDLMRERVSNNIGEASDEQISRIAITSRIVVTVRLPRSCVRFRSLLQDNVDRSISRNVGSKDFLSSSRMTGNSE
jgi:type IV secretory pathway VirB10-like protein